MRGKSQHQKRVHANGVWIGNSKERATEIKHVHLGQRWNNIMQNMLDMLKYDDVILRGKPHLMQASRRAKKSHCAFWDKSHSTESGLWWDIIYSINMKYRWFTLIEILLVTMIIGIMLTMSISAMTWLLAQVKFKSAREIFLSDYNSVIVKSLVTPMQDVKLLIGRNWDTLLSLSGSAVQKELFLFSPTPLLDIVSWTWVLWFKNVWCTRNESNIQPPQIKFSYRWWTVSQKCYQINLTSCKITLVTCQ